MARAGTPYNPEDMEVEETSGACEFFETEDEAYERIRKEVEAEARAKAQAAARQVPQGESFDPSSYSPPQPRPASYCPPPQGDPVIPGTLPQQGKARADKKPLAFSTKVAIAVAVILLGFVTGLIPAVIAGIIWVVQAAFVIAFMALIAYIVYRLTRTDEERERAKEKRKNKNSNKNANSNGNSNRGGDSDTKIH